MANICAIKFTDLCNMVCPWCLAEKEMQSCGRGSVRLWDSTTKVETYKRITITDYDGYNITGGEPLLYPEEVKELVLFIRDKKGKGVSINVFTNGSLITKDIVEFFNANNVSVVLSLNLVGYKNPVNLLSCSSNPEELFDNIRGLHSLCIRGVFAKGTPFAYDSYVIHELFPNSVSEMSFDYTDFGNWTEGDLDFIANELSKLEKLTPNFEWFSVTLLACTYCESKTHGAVHPDGVWRGVGMCRDIPGDGIYGCLGLYHALTPKLYNRYMVICDKVRKRTTPFNLNGIGESLCRL